MFILCCFPKGPSDSMGRLILTEPVVGTIEKMEGERSRALEDRACRQHSSHLGLESALGKKSHRHARVAFFS